MNNSSKTNIVQDSSSDEDSDVDMVDAPGHTDTSKDGVKVEPFYGNREKLGYFLTQLKTTFKLNPTRYAKAEDKVMFAAMHLKGAAFYWFKPVWDDYLESSSPDDETKACFRNFAQFEEMIKQIYGTVNEAAVASRTIYTLKQTGSVANYYSEFKKLAKELEYKDENVFKDTFYNGLKKEVRQEMMERPETYKKMVDKAIELDNRLYELRMEENQGRSSGRRGYRGYRYSPRANTGRPRDYGDPMDLDAMTRKGRDHPNPKRARGFRRYQGEANRDRDRQRKENLCYRCSKPGHHAHDCPEKSARGLHMMNIQSGGADGSIAKKADTIDKIQSPTEGKDDQTQDSAKGNGETAQKDHRSDSPDRLDESRQKWDEHDQDGEEFYQRSHPIRPRRTKKQLRKFNADIAISAQCMMIRRKVRQHAEESWHFCYDDECQVHLASKTENEWFPHEDQGTTEPRRKPNGKGQETLAMMNKDKTDEEIYCNESVAVVKTFQWEDGKETPHQRPGNWYNPGSKQDTSILVNLLKCTSQYCHDKENSHTHSVLDGTAYPYQFEETGEYEMIDEVVVAKTHMMIFTTNYYQVRQENGKEKLIFDPAGKPQGQKRPVSIQTCYNTKCVAATTYHTHDTVDGQVVDFNPLDQTIGGIPAKLRVLDQTEEWEQTSESEEESETPDQDNGSRYAVIQVTAAWIRIATNYWKYEDCEEECAEGDQPHTHVAYCPRGEPRRTIQEVYVSFCRNPECENGPNIHSHLRGDKETIMELTMKSEQAYALWQTTTPTTRHIQPRRQLTQQGVLVEDRVRQGHASSYFTCVDKKCEHYYRIHQHEWNVDPAWPELRIDKKEYLQQWHTYGVCMDFNCRYKQQTHIHPKNDWEMSE